MVFNNYGQRIVTDPIPYGPICPPRGRQMSDFDLSTFLQDAVKTVNNLVNPAKPAPVMTVQQQLAPTQASLTSIAGIPINATTLLLGGAAIAAVFYFTRQKGRRR